jgi:hypothetical protein
VPHCGTKTTLSALAPRLGTEGYLTRPSPDELAAAMAKVTLAASTPPVAS